ncbi:MAG: mechanosensitive ion channel family protein, partial [Pseudomonadota bacterium]
MLNDLLEGPLFQTEIYNGQTLEDFLSLEFIASVLGSILSAILIIIAGFIVAGWVSRRIKGIAGRHRSLDVTLFEFLAQIARYV